MDVFKRKRNLCIKTKKTKTRNKPTTRGLIYFCLNVAQAGSAGCYTQ